MTTSNELKPMFDAKALRAAGVESALISSNLEKLKLARKAFIDAVLATIKNTHPDLPNSKIKLTISATGAAEDLSIEYEKTVSRVVYDKPVVGVLRFDEKRWSVERD